MYNLQKNRLLILIILVGLIGLAASFYYQQQMIRKNQDEPNNQDKLRSQAVYQAEIDGWILNLEVVDDYLARSQGLAGRKNLPADYGMLFVFSDKKIRNFWMKNMLVPIDIIWISDNRIVGIEPNVLPEPGVSDRELTLYRSPLAVDQVLEVRAGLATEQNWQIGTEIVYLNY